MAHLIQPNFKHQGLFAAVLKIQQDRPQAIGLEVKKYKFTPIQQNQPKYVRLGLLLV